MSTTGTQAAAGTALVLCKHAQTRQVIIESLKPLSIRPEICEEALAAIKLLDRQKFEAVIVDLQLGEEARLVMGHLHLSRANRTAVSFAITPEEATLARRPNSTFVLQRPLSIASVGHTLRAAYGLVVRERRRYFRCPVTVPVYVDARGPKELSCQTVNISEGGIAIRCSTALDSNSPLRVRFSLPDHSTTLFADAKVCWWGESMLFGLEFQSLAQPQRSELQEWLARKLDETLPEEVVSLFRNAGQALP